jgi:hypothetical protein
LADKFGDGWDDSRLFVMDGYGHYGVYYPDCFINPLNEPIICFHSSVNQNGDFVVARVIGNGKFPWEVCFLRLSSGVCKSYLF